MIARTLALAFGLLGSLALSQAPEFAQQYRQRLGGAVDELRRVVERFDDDARVTGLTREDALNRMTGGDAFVQRQGDAMRESVVRLSRLQSQQHDMTVAGPFSRMFVMLRDMDPGLARAAYRDFEPAMPVTEEGFVMAGFGFLAGWGGLLFLASLMSSMARRTRRRWQRRPRRSSGPRIVPSSRTASRDAAAPARPAPEASVQPAAVLPSPGFGTAPAQSSAGSPSPGFRISATKNPSPS